MFCTRPLSRCRVSPPSSTKISKPLNSMMFRLDRRRMPFSTPDTAATVATPAMTRITTSRLVWLWSMPNRYSRPEDTCSEPIPRLVTRPSRVTNMPKMSTALPAAPLTQRSPTSGYSAERSASGWLCR
ncbi:hypothetical protein D3C78_1022130 [compost metagenome]